MSEYTTFPAEGIYHLIIEEMTRDAQVWGAVDATELQITYQPSGSERAPTFMTDGDEVVLSKANVQRITVPASMNVTVKRASGDLHVQRAGRRDQHRGGARRRAARQLVGHHAPRAR